MSVNYLTTILFTKSELTEITNITNLQKRKKRQRL